MKPAIFIEVVFAPGSLKTAGFEGRDEVEDPLDDALKEAGYGEVVGGGSGIRGTNIDVEITADVTVEEAIAFLRQALRDVRVDEDLDIRVPGDTRLIVRQPLHQVFTFHE